MKVTRRSMFTGITHTLDIPGVTQEMLDEHESTQGRSIQAIMPHVPAELREFIMTGVTPEEWEETFGKSEED